jgi:hypothetical protein
MTSSSSSRSKPPLPWIAWCAVRPITPLRIVISPMSNTVLPKSAGPSPDRNGTASSMFA